MTVYYNEIDPFAAAWLRNLIAAGHIAPGDVDERSIVDVRATDLVGYSQCHFFAGIGGWSHALRLAGWGDNRPCWTGSCPCQPLSSAGRQRGHADERHLWPAFHALIAQCRPATVFGEQVASKDGREWFAGIRADLEGTGYACGCANLCAAGAGAPHIRQRIYWVGQSDSTGKPGEIRGVQGRAHILEPSRSSGGLADAEHDGSLVVEQSGGAQDQGRLFKPKRYSASGRLGDAASWRPQGSGRSGSEGERWLPGPPAPRRPESFWSSYDLVPCSDGKTRRTGPGIFPLVDRATARVGRLRAYGNAIVPQVAAAFIEAYLDA